MRIIPLTQGYVALVDDADYASVACHKWCAFINPRTPTPYAIRNATVDGRRVTVYLHREIMGAAPSQRVDHINGDGLDCRRENMRLCSIGENGRNRRKHRKTASRYKGVTPRADKWRSRIRVNGVLYDLGTHSTEEAAAMAYDMAAVHHHGAFARLNFPARHAALR